MGSVQGTNRYQYTRYMVPFSTTQEATLRKSAKNVSEKNVTETPRERVLSAAFAALEELGIQKVSTLEIATRAKVSKRELYSLFEDKNALILECIKWRTAQLQISLALPQPKTKPALQTTLVEFGTSLVLGVCDASVITMFRLAIAEAESSPEIARVLNESGRQSSRKALAKLLQQASGDQLIAFDDVNEATELFFALLWGDLQMRLLLGLSPGPTKSEAKARATHAVSCFLAVYSPHD